MVEGAPHTAKRSKGSIVLYGVPPSSIYKGGEEGDDQDEEACPRGGVLLPPGVGLLLFLFGEGEGRKRKEGGRKGGPGPPPNLDWACEGAPPPLLLSPPFH